jgi:Reverse transcriptase (RNA-dependent DNA polymerase)
VIGKREEVDILKKELQVEFEMKDMGPVEYFLGMSVERNRARKMITLSQEPYLKVILGCFAMVRCNSVSTPVAMGTTLAKSMENDGLELIEERDYQCLVGSMMWAMLGTRPDIAFLICLTSQYNSKPNTSHEAVGKRGLRYLSGTQNLALVFDGRHGINMKGYVDAGFANLEGRTCISGWISLWQVQQ